jgi:lipid-binding SYLF domain-containing protein
MVFSPPPPSLNSGPKILTTPPPTIATLPGSVSWHCDSSQNYCFQCATEFLPASHSLDILSKLLPGARRHHCRRCGHIFCQDCSSRRALLHPDNTVLRGYSAKYSAATAGGGEVGRQARAVACREPQRVCDPCYAEVEPQQQQLRAQFSNAQRFNSTETRGWLQRTFNSPLAFTLGHEVRKAAATLENLLPAPRRLASSRASSVLSNLDDDTDFGNSRGGPDELCSANLRETCTTSSSNLRELDGVRIPARLLERAKGIAVLTVAKAGLWVGGEFGTGLVVARLPDGTWSAPSAIGLVGFSVGALMGAQVSDHVFLLMTDQAVEMLGSSSGSINLGADVGVAVGPVGRSLEVDVGVGVGDEGGAMAGIYTYSLTKGLYMGASFDGKVIATRHDVNERFYGMCVEPYDLLSGDIPPPPAAQPLYASLKRCSTYTKNLLGDVGEEIGWEHGRRSSLGAVGGIGGVAIGGVGGVDGVVQPQPQPQPQPHSQPQPQPQPSAFVIGEVEDRGMGGFAGSVGNKVVESNVGLGAAAASSDVVSTAGGVSSGGGYIGALPASAPAPAARTTVQYNTGGGSGVQYNSPAVFSPPPANAAAFSSHTQQQQQQQQPAAAPVSNSNNNNNSKGDWPF